MDTTARSANSALEEGERLRDLLRRREAELVRFAYNIPEPVIYFDRPMRYGFANRAFLEPLGKRRDEVVGHTVEEVRGPEFAAEVRPYIERAFRGEPVMFEKLAPQPDGTHRWRRARMMPDFDADGTVVGVYAIIVDIDEVKRAQEAVRAAESRMRMFTENIPEPVAYLDRNLRYAIVNHAYSTLVRHPAGWIIGRTIEEVIGAEAARFFGPQLDQVRRGERTTYERQRVEPDGRVRWMHGVLVPETDANGFAGFYVVIHDITDMKQAQALLAQREGQLRSFLDGIPAPVAFINRHRQYEFVNDAFAEFSDLEPAKITGRPLREVARPEDYARQTALLDRAFAGEQIDYERLTPFRRRPSRWMQVRLVPERDADGTIGGVFVLLNDIHAQKETQAAIRHINWVLSSHMENTPMAVLEWNEHFDLVRWSKQAEAIFGWRAEDVLGRKVREWWLVHEDDVAQVEGVIDAMVSGRQTATSSVNRNVRKDGTVIWCEWHNSVLRDEHGNVLSILSFVQDISDRVDAQARLETMATHDALTGLPNRMLLHRHLAGAVERARERHEQVAVLFIDLDRFKNVNDSLGHRIGDELLQMIGRRLGMALRKGDFLARLGGDEFTVLLENAEGAEGAAQVAAKLLELIQQPYWVRGHAVHVSGSIGVSLYPEDGEDPDTLLKHADVAMYRAKDAGRNVYRQFAREMGDEQQERMVVETALRQAMRERTMTLVYQPKVETRTGRIIGAEALMRWHDPTLGEIPPSRFIPLAEESGLIEVLGDWVLREACEQAQQWATAGRSDLSVAINLSVRQFRDPEFAARIQRIFEDTGIDPGRVEFEVTETSVLYDPDTVSKVLQLERAVGARVAIDDFGTGYSSLVHLKRLPIDTLKIDQSFIRDITTDPDDRAISAAIIALAHSLGLTVVAEGVETAEQLAVLRGQGCDYCQGHYFSRPVEAREFIDLVSGARPLPAPPA